MQDRQRIKQKWQRGQAIQRDNSNSLTKPLFVAHANLFCLLSSDLEVPWLDIARAHGRADWQRSLDEIPRQNAQSSIEKSATPTFA
jgi:hypothetical protein